MVNLAKDLAESIAEYEASENKAKAEAAASIFEDGHRLILKCVDLMEKLVAIEADKMEVAERTYQMLMVSEPSLCLNSQGICADKQRRISTTQRGTSITTLKFFGLT